MPRVKAYLSKSRGFAILVCLLAAGAGYYYPSPYQEQRWPKERWVFPMHPTAPVIKPILKMAPKAPRMYKAHAKPKNQVYAIPAWIKALPHAKQEEVCTDLNLYYEARGEGDAGMAMVATVVDNRIKANRAHWGKTVCENVFLKTKVKRQAPNGKAKHAWRCEFSWVCDRKINPRRAQLAKYPVIARIREAHLGGTYTPPPHLRTALYYCRYEHSSPGNQKYFDTLEYLDKVGNHRVYTDLRV